MKLNLFKAIEFVEKWEMMGDKIKKTICLLVLGMMVSGCASMQEFNQRGQNDIEHSNYIYEKTYRGSYREGFIACLNYLIEGNAEVYLKDYARGIILARIHSNSNWSMPSDNMGLYINKINSEEIKVTLKLSGLISIGGRKANPEDAFNTINKEIKFQRQIKNM